jgi:hypothetical protein
MIPRTATELVAYTKTVLDIAFADAQWGKAYQLVREYDDPPVHDDYVEITRQALKETT